jgi:hypothetical protein
MLSEKEIKFNIDKSTLFANSDNLQNLGLNKILQKRIQGYIKIVHCDDVRIMGGSNSIEKKVFSKGNGLKTKILLAQVDK